MPVDNESDTLVEFGSVLDIRPGKAVVKIRRSKDCGGCHECSFIDQDGGMVAEVDNPLGASRGDTVRIATRGAEGKAKAALLLYGFPLLMMLAGAIGSQPLFKSIGLGSAAELLSVLSGLILLAASFVVLYLVQQRKGKGSVRSRIVEILEGSQVTQLSQ